MKTLIKKFTPKQIYQTAQVFGGLTFIISAIALTGHLLREFGLYDAERLYRWTLGNVGMAIPTAIALMLLSLSVFMLASLVERKYEL